MFKGFSFYENLSSSIMAFWAFRSNFLLTIINSRFLSNCFQVRFFSVSFKIILFTDLDSQCVEKITCTYVDIMFLIV